MPPRGTVERSPRTDDTVRKKRVQARTPTLYERIMRLNPNRQRVNAMKYTGFGGRGKRSKRTQSELRHEKEGNVLEQVVRQFQSGRASADWK